jgi:hypothetical protein
MSIKFERKFLRPDELLQRWQCGEADLKYEVIEGDLSPIIFVNRPEEITDREGLAVFGPDEHYRLPNEDDLLGPDYLNRGYLVLRGPIREGIDTCSFSLFSQYQERWDGCVCLSDRMFPLEKYWHEMVFDLPNVLRFEADRTQGAKFAESNEKPLSTAERNQLLKMVLGMAIDSYGYDPVAKKNDATKQIVDDLAKLGIGIDPDTVRKYLKEAANSVTYEVPKPK